MKEFTEDALAGLPPEYNTSQLLVDRAARPQAHPLYTVRDPRTEAWLQVSAATVVELATALAKRLVADGLAEGEPVAIMSHTNVEWSLIEQAVWFAGGLPVPVYETSSAHQVAWILEDSGARRVFVENESIAAVVAEAAEALGSPVTAWLMEGEEDSAPEDPSGVPLLPGVRSMIASGRSSAVPDAEIEARRSAPALADPATIVYTSGTQGRPKGCIISHANFCLVAVNLGQSMAQVVQPGARTALFLPLAHVLARAVQHACVATGTTVGFTTPARLTSDLPAIKPTWLLAVPRIYEKLLAGALNAAEATGKGKLFKRAVAVATAKGYRDDAVARGEKPRRRPLNEAQFKLFDRLVYPKIRAVVGGDVRWTISGASALNPDLAAFFNAIGMGVLEGYGLTETTAPALVNRPGHTKVGTVGQPIPATTVALAEDGEVLLKGIGVFPGYWRNNEATAQAFDADGFFRTGDLGTLDEQGFLRITGRKKDLIVTAGGKNVSPGPLEDIIRAGRLVSQAVVIGENRPFISALVTLDADELGPWSATHGLTAPLTPEQAATTPEVLSEVQSYVDAANATVSRAEAIRKFVVLPKDFAEADEHLTPSMKVRRAAVLKDYAHTVSSMYQR